MWLQGDADALWMVAHIVDGEAASSNGMSVNGYSEKINADSTNVDAGMWLTFDIYNGQLVVSEQTSVTTLGTGLSWPRSEWLSTSVDKTASSLSCTINRADGTLFSQISHTLTKTFAGKSKERFGFQARTGARSAIFRVKDVVWVCNKTT
jgi:hypothetical protein